MKNEILKQIEISNEILSIMPRSTEDEKRLFINESKKTYAEYNLYKIQIINELKQRKTHIESIVKEEPYQEYNFEDIISKMKLLNTINTSYEKLRLDKSLLGLKKFYKSNLVDVNNYIFDTLEIFRKVGIILSEKDFFYDESVKLYISELVSVDRSNYIIDNIKIKFEQLYWKAPKIITYIQLNFKSVYFKNIKIFNKYIDKIHKESDKKIEDLNNEYGYKVTERDNYFNSSSKYFLESFVNEKLSLKDYTNENIRKISSQFFDGDVFLKEKTIISLEKTLSEYKTYIKFNFIVEEIRKEILGKSKEKINSGSKLKEISKLEKQLIKAIKKKESLKDEIVEKIIIAYDEYDELYFKEKLFGYMNNKSKIIDAFKFAISYYEYFIKLSKKNDEDITIDEINDNLKELEMFVRSPYNMFINNLEILGGYDVALIVLDRYKLENINITKEDIEKDALDTAIKNVGLLCNYYKIAKLEKIDLSKIIEYYKINNLLKKVK